MSALLVLTPLTYAEAFAPAVDGSAAGHLPNAPMDAASAAMCGELERLDVDAVGLCTHGDDVAPARAAAANEPGEPMPSRDPICIGNGNDGQRVEVVYVVRDGASGPSSARVTAIRRWVGQVEWTVRQSAARFGDERHVRWRTNADCEVVVRTHRVSSAALGDFEEMIDELRADGFTSSSRTYLLFVDSTTYCGIATAPRDDDKDNNRADRTAGYARVDRNCWDTGDEGYHSIAAHELFHTLGAVQESAPHATPGAHCTDEHDVMCYDDGTGGRMNVVCRDSDPETSGAGDWYDRLLDCGGNDYFHTRPSGGNYLATHWNTADSARLYDPDAKQSGGNGGGSSGSGSGGGGGSTKPSPTQDPIGYVLDLIGG